MKQKLLAALMIITLCVSGSASVMAAENESIMKDVTEEKQEAEDTFTEDNVSEKNKLSSPTNVQWTDDWDMQWKCVPEAMGHYDFIIEKMENSMKLVRGKLEMKMGLLQQMSLRLLWKVECIGLQ